MSNAAVRERPGDIRPERPDVAVLKRLLDERWSCRGFLPDAVPRDEIVRMLDLAQRAPSWCNSQPWQVHVTAGAATERFREGISAQARSRPGAPPEPDFPFPRAYEGVFKERRRECGWQLYESVGIAPGDRAASAEQGLENFRLFGAPHVLIVTTEADLGTYGAVDCGIYLAHLLLAARSLGIATIPQAAIAGFAPFVREFFGLPAHRLVVAAVSFGFADPDHRANGFRTRRASLEQVAHWVET